MPEIKKPVPQFRNNALADALKQADISPEGIIWFEHERRRQFAPCPKAMLRRIAKKQGFRSVADLIHHEREERIAHLEHRLHHA